MLSQSDSRRVGWDVFMALLLFYIAVSLPFALAFGAEGPGGPVADEVMNWLFLLDVGLNFRTGYADQEGLEVRKRRAASR